MPGKTILAKLRTWRNLFVVLKLGEVVKAQDYDGSIQPDLSFLTFRRSLLPLETRIGLRLDDCRVLLNEGDYGGICPATNLILLYVRMERWRGRTLSDTGEQGQPAMTNFHRIADKSSSKGRGDLRSIRWSLRPNMTAGTRHFQWLAP